MILELSKKEILDVNEIVYAKMMYREQRPISLNLRTKGGESYYYESNMKELETVFQVIYDNIKDRK